VAAYRQLLAGVMMRSLDADAHNWGMELSGGLDSATLALCATELGSVPMRTFGLEIEGPAALQQRARRADVAQRIGSQDGVFPASACAPLSDIARGEWLGPHAEIYASAFDQLLRQASDQGVQRMVNGVGGDELMLPHYSERKEHPEVAAARPRTTGSPSFITRDARQLYKTSYWNIGHAPRTLVPRSTLLSLASRAPVFLRRGIWPVSPFASLDAVRFCRRLPAEWRNNKHLHRAVLAHSGCAPTTVHPDLHENFHSVLTEALRFKQCSLLRDLFAHSKLAEEGFVDEQKLLKAYQLYAKDGRLTGEERFYEVAVLELLLRGA
jgi:asparagine synthase (glutamine-hydrolysing)